MTGHSQPFLTTLQATLDILDDVSGALPENTYLTITNNLQQLYNIHTSNSTSNPPITTPINYTRNDYVSTISYASIRNFDSSNVDIITNNNNNANNNTINENIQSRIQSLNEESNRLGYSTRTRLILYGNVFNNAAN